MKSEPAEEEMAWFVDLSEKGVLGRNATGTSWVYRGIYHNQQVAIKRVAIDEVEETKQDVLISLLEHQNVVKLLHVEENDLFKFFILELCASSLQGFFDQDYNGPMPTDVEVLCQLSGGLDYIHSKGYVYRKVKPENILISSTTPVVMKWADFGLTKLTKIYDSPESSSSEPLCWMSPEVLSNGDGTCVDSKESDIFSAGCVYFYYLTRAHPFGKKSVVKKNVMEGNPISAARLANDHFAKTVITRMIAKEPAQRITLAEVIDGLKQPSIPQQPSPQKPIPQPIPHRPIPPQPSPQKPIPQTIPQPIPHQPFPPQPIPAGVASSAPRYITAEDITPISGLEPGFNSGTIRVKVVSRPKVGNWKKNAGLSMKFFTVLLRDDTGEIEAKAFGENFERFYKLFKVRKEYAIKRATLKVNGYGTKELSLLKATTIECL